MTKADAVAVVVLEATMCLVDGVQIADCKTGRGGIPAAEFVADLLCYGAPETKEAIHALGRIESITTFVDTYFATAA